MNNVLVIDYTKERSADLRTKREVNFVLSEREASIEAIVSAEYLLIMGDMDIPMWVAQVRCLHVSPGGYPKSLTVQLGRIASLEANWGQIQPLLRYQSLSHAQTKPLDVEAIFEAGKLITANEGEAANTLTAAEAATRLAWTYGVKDDQIKISIQL